MSKAIKQLRSERHSLINQRRCYTYEEFVESCFVIKTSKLNWPTETYISIFQYGAWSHYPEIIKLLDFYLEEKNKLLGETKIREVKVGKQKKGFNNSKIVTVLILDISSCSVEDFTSNFLSNIKNLQIEFITPKRIINKRIKTARNKERKIINQNYTDEINNILKESNERISQNHVIIPSFDMSNIARELTDIETVSESNNWY